MDRVGGAQATFEHESSGMGAAKFGQRSACPDRLAQDAKMVR